MINIGLKRVLVLEIVHVKVPAMCIVGSVEVFGSMVLQVQFELEHKLTPRKSLR
jgi:hypothetical protein